MWMRLSKCQFIEDGKQNRRIFLKYTGKQAERYFRIRGQQADSIMSKTTASTSGLGVSHSLQGVMTDEAKLKALAEKSFFIW